MIGSIPSGMPPVALPPFSIPDVSNETTGEILQPGESFFEMVSSMGSGLIVVPLIALLENMSICKAFGGLKLLLKRVFLLNFSQIFLQLMANLLMQHRN